MAARLWRVALVTLCLAVHACDIGSGGAVELSWKLRPASSALKDPFVSCESASQTAGWGPVTGIQLHWKVGTTEGARDWVCDANHGATGFDLPEGIAELSVAPECAPGELAAQETYIAPAIVQRNVIRGETVSLGAVELVVSVTRCATAGPQDPNRGDQPCVCGTPPSPN